MIRLKSLSRPLVSLVAMLALDARGNCEVERAAFHYRDAAGIERTGAVIDIHLATQR